MAFAFNLGDLRKRVEELIEEYGELMPVGCMLDIQHTVTLQMASKTADGRTIIDMIPCHPGFYMTSLKPEIVVINRTTGKLINKKPTDERLPSEVLAVKFNG